MPHYRSPLGLVLSAATSMPESIFASCADSGRRISWRDLWWRADRIARDLLPSSIEAQTIALIPCHSEIEFYILLIACWMRGLIPLPLEPELKDAEVSALRDDLSGSFFVLSLKKFSESSTRLSKKLNCKLVVWNPDDFSKNFCNERPAISGIEFPGNFSLAMATSGSSSRRKLILFSNEEIFSGATLQAGACPPRGRRFLNLRPLCTAGGLYPLWPALLGQREIILSGNLLKAPFFSYYQKLISLVEPNEISAPLTLFRSMALTSRAVDDVRGGNLISKRVIYLLVVGEPISAHDLELLRKPYGLTPTIRYSMTECINTISVGEPHLCDLTEPGFSNVGRPLPGVAVEVKNNIEITSPGASCAYMERGSVRYRPIVGKIVTDDAGRVERDGTLILYGRGPTWICRSGMRFSCFEVEDVINEHSNVSDVVVVPRPDALAGQIPVAFLVLVDPQEKSSTFREVLDLCHLRLAARKVPVELKMVSSIPRTASGKRDFQELLSWAQVCDKT